MHYICWFSFFLGLFNLFTSLLFEIRHWLWCIRNCFIGSHLHRQLKYHAIRPFTVCPLILLLWKWNYNILGRFVSIYTSNFFFFGLHIYEYSKRKNLFFYIITFSDCSRLVARWLIKSILFPMEWSPFLFLIL